MKNISVALFLCGIFTLYSCQQNAKQNDEGNNTVSQDSTTTGLEGTHDQSGTIGGTEVKVDTSAGGSNVKQSDDSLSRAKKSVK